MATLRDIRVTSMAGNTIAELQSLDLKDLTGLALRHRVGQVTGFPSVAIKLLSADVCLPDGACLVESLDQSACSDSTVSLTCVLERSQPAGKKGDCQRHFRTKAGLFVSTRLRQAVNKDGMGKVFLCERIPHPDLREQAEALITESFAKHLEPLILMGIAAAYNSAGHADTSPAPHFMYEDSEHNAYADLSSCQLWMKVVNPEIQEAVGTARYEICPLVCAVLWRLLPAPPPAVTECKAQEAPAGPVLEVLFLATTAELREVGQAQALVSELEGAAKQMGCFAIAVAAVPSQGISFWTRCGYEVAVPLEEGGLGEPSNALGAFLAENMLLFTDTPLVAKVL